MGCSSEILKKKNVKDTMILFCGHSMKFFTPEIPILKQNVVSNHIIFAQDPRRYGKGSRCGAACIPVNFIRETSPREGAGIERTKPWM